MPFRKKTTYVDPHDAASELSSGALALFQQSQADLEAANELLEQAVADDEAFIASLQERVSKGKTAVATNAKVAGKIADILGP